MIYQLKGRAVSLQAPSIVITLRCPACKQIGTLDSISLPGNRQVVLQDLFLQPPQIILGQRSCPNPACLAHVFVVWDVSKQHVEVSYPAERIDFDTTNIPKPITAALEEAITCHASRCFIAAAIMVRKTLEELCSVRAANGPNLKERIKALGATIVLPADLLNGLDDIRLLGNDAAHIESQEYAKVDQEEVEVAIEFTKEVLKSAYQYSALLARLRALKKNP